MEQPSNHTHTHTHTESQPTSSKAGNRLAGSSSPYLLQHADNPVNWYPWGPEAFQKAREQDKPIFLSIGYSTCHWCHVMEEESFEDAEVARLMNDTFISIKVDREERPDIDNIYMTVCQMMTGSGGWPLTIIMTPDKKPFFAGTYIPKFNRFGRPGMVNLVPMIKQMWQNQRAELLTTADRVASALGQTAIDASDQALDLGVLNSAYQQLADRFDTRHGGFSMAPKFPTAHNLTFLLRYWKRTGRQDALEMVVKTLQQMLRGGMYDQIGFGFHRYSTDSAWLVPHFEKMLYDQALLAIAYIEAYQATGQTDFADTAKQIFDYVLREMKSPAGGFYSAQDADTQGEEGKLYLWTERQIRDVLDKQQAELVIKVYNIEKDGNFVEQITGQKTGQNILHLTKPLDQIAKDLELSPDDLQSRLDQARSELFAAREKRVPVYKDDKILTDWNGLMIAALAKGAKVIGNEKYSQVAANAADFILTEMRLDNGRLLHRYRAGQAGIAANVDDYAFFIWGLIELYEATFEIRYLKTALNLNDDLVKHFWDDQAGGFYFTADDSEQLLIRPKEGYDGAVPSGNSVAMMNLLRLGRLTANPKLEELADKVGKAFWPRVKQVPTGFAHMLSAVDFAFGPSYEIVIVGSPTGKDTRS